MKIMEINHENTTIETPIDKHKVVLKLWITGGEARELRNVFLSKIGFGEEKEKYNSAEVANEAENKAIEMIVISIDGEIEGILDKILNMRSKDFNFVMKEINKISRDARFLGEESVLKDGTDSED